MRPNNLDHSFCFINSQSQLQSGLFKYSNEGTNRNWLKLVTGPYQYSILLLLVKKKKEITYMIPGLRSAIKFCSLSSKNILWPWIVPDVTVLQNGYTDICGNGIKDTNNTSYLFKKMQKRNYDQRD